MKKFLAMLMAVAMVFSIVTIPVIAEPEDTASKKAESSQPVAPQDAATLDEALNVSGGNLVFTTEGEYAWVVDGDAAKSSNEGASDSSSAVSTTVTAVEGDILQFDFMSFGEGSSTIYDGLHLYVDGTEVMVWSIVENWTTYATALSAGEHTIMWTYEKDGSVDNDGDYATVDNVYVGEPVHPSAVEVEDVTVPAGRVANVQYTVLPAEAFYKDVTFATADENIAIIDNGRVRGVSEGTTTITVTTVDGGISGTATVTVTEALPSVTLYGYIAYDPNNESNAGYWGTFEDYDPSVITNLGAAADTYAAASVGHMIYGFNLNISEEEDYRFYYIDTDEGMTPVYPGTAADRGVFAMAFDYTTNTMYAIAEGGANTTGLYIVDRALGTLTEVGMFDTDEIIMTLAIDENGVGYVVSREGNLYIVDLETTELTLVGSVGLRDMYIHYLTYDMNSHQLFWAMYDESGNDGLYTIDTETAEISLLGHIGCVDGRGVVLTGLLTLNDIDVPAPEMPDITVTFVDGLAGSTLSTMVVEAGTVLDESNFPTPPTHEGYDFVGWKYNGKPIYSDTIITAQYHDPNATTATIIFEADDVWGDGSGYQFLIDADATAYGSVFSESDSLTVSGDAPAGVYDEFEYKIPENADGSLTTTNVLIGETVTIEIPAGIYDWCITNPTPGDCIWIASEDGTIGGRADDFEFIAGNTYYFHVYYHASSDAVDLEITGLDYTITYTINGEEYATRMYKYGTEVTAPEYTIPEGYSFFSGWDVPETMPARNFVIDATLTPNTYTITYTIDGEEYTTRTYDYGTEVVPPEYSAPEGYTFSGWTVPETMPAENITLNATLTPNTYTITYTINGQVYTTRTYDYGTEVIAPEYTAEDGYTFSGWYVPEIMPAEDITVDAQCIINVYSVTFYDLDGSIISEQDVEHGAAAIAPPDPAREGLVFAGWDANFSVITSDCEIHALYDPIPHSGDINGDGEVTSGDVTILMRHVLGFYPETLTPGQIEAADFNGDGILNATDALLIMRSIIGLLETNANSGVAANLHDEINACEPVSFKKDTPLM